MAASPSPAPNATSASAMPTPTPAPADEGQMSFERFSDEATPQPGLFTVWRKHGRVFLEVASTQFDRTFMIAPILASGLGEGVFAGIEFDPILVQFHRVGDEVVIEAQNPYGKARAGSPQERAVAISYPPSVLDAQPLTAIDHRAGGLIFPADLFLSDLEDLSDAINGPAGPGGSPVRYRLDSRLSYFGPTKSFPNNIDIETDLTFGSSMPGPIDTVPDPRSLFVRLSYSVMALPDDGYRPRLADDRIGYFVTARRQYDDPNGPTSFVRYINRWNMQKANPSARISPAKNPIVYYIANDVPLEYRDPIRAALLTWNRAFAAIGITGAIEVRQQPDDPSWDPDDVRYSVVRWVESPGSAFAYGPSLVNPLTGEIFRADIVIDGNLVRSGAGAYENFLDPTRVATELNRGACSAQECDYGEGEQQQLAWGELALGLDGRFGASGEAPTWFTKAFVQSIVLHESGHTLGLRHNFEASTIYSLKQLHDAKFTAAHGLAGSVMEYTPLNLSPHGQPQGAYFQTKLGPADYFTIKYGYQAVAGRSTDDERAALNAIASQSTAHDLIYGTDEDDEWFDGFATDPRVSTFALGSDVLAFVQNQLTIDQRLFQTLSQRLPRRGDSYESTRYGMLVAMNNWYRSAMFATHYIGGEYFSRNHRGDLNERPPFVPVARADEQRAFAMLTKYVFADDAFSYPPSLLQRLGSDRFSHWESDPNASGRLDLPVDEFAQAYQALLLRQMWQPTVLARLDGVQAVATHPSETMSLADLFDWTDNAVWGDLKRGGLSDVPAVHRALQQRYAGSLVNMMLHPERGTPSDAVALARHHLVWLRDQLDASLAHQGLDEVTRANFEDIRTNVGQALNATTLSGR
ncbi:MAG TPA: zinc-dependent metalloprotease [Candidatus Eremiobacteraceae bacterium]